MKIVADENVDKHIVDSLRACGHDVLFIGELDPGIEDETVLGRSRQLNAILVTADKDFGDLVFRSPAPAPRRRSPDQTRWSDTGA